MWVISTTGFYSVVQHREDPTTMLVRARTRKDLERLCDLSDEDVHPPEEGGWPKPEMIIENTVSDYPCRMFMPRMMWANCQTELTDVIDYSNFKDQVKKEQGAERAQTYMGVWSRLRQIEHEGREPEEFDWDWADSQMTMSQRTDCTCTIACGGEAVTGIEECWVHGGGPVQ